MAVALSPSPRSSRLCPRDQAVDGGEHPHADRASGGQAHMLHVKPSWSDGH